MRTRLVSLFSFAVALGLAAGTAQAADKFECPAAAGQDKPTLAADLLKTVPGEVLRWALLSGHYRAPLDWTPELIEQSRRNLDRLYGALQRVQDIEVGEGEPPAAVVEALSDDLNTPKAYAELFALAKILELSKGAERAAAKADLLAAGNLMGFLSAEPDAWFAGAADDDLRAKVEVLLEQRVAARAAKDWPKADAIRGELDALGVVVMDGPAGATWRLKEPA